MMWKFVAEALGEGLVLKTLSKAWEMVFQKIAEKGAEKIGKRVEKILGFDTEEAKKDITDEVVYGVVVNALANVDAERAIDAFEERLRREDKEKAEAFVLFVAKIVMKFERVIKETVTPEKGKTGPRTEQTYNDITEGIGHAKKFLESLLANVGSNENETFNLRIAFLQGKNVFSLVSTKKPEGLFERKMGEFTQKASDAIKKGVTVDAPANMDSINAGMGSLVDRARRWRDRI